MLVKRPYRTLFLYFVVAFSLLLLVGCGGSGEPMATSGGRVSLKIAWPAPSRYIPNYAASIVFRLYTPDSEATPRSIVVNRPETLPLVETVTFEGPIPSDVYVITGKAMTGANGNGVVVASANDLVFVAPTGTTTVAMTLGTTLASIELLDVPLNMAVGEARQLIAKVLDKDGNQVILPTGALNWSVLFGGDSVQLSGDGVVSAIAVGQARVRVSEIGAFLYSEGDIAVAEALGGIKSNFDAAAKLRGVK